MPPSALAAGAAATGLHPRQATPPSATGDRDAGEAEVAAPAIADVADGARPAADAASTPLPSLAAGYAAWRAAIERRAAERAAARAADALAVGS